MTSTLVKPAHKSVKDYYRRLKEFAGHQVYHEQAVRTAFLNLLSDTARKRHWVVVPEAPYRVNGDFVVPDGTVRDEFQMPRGYWEAKDTSDRLDDEIQKKIDKGYPLSNIIFEDTRTGVLYQERQRMAEFDLHQPAAVADLLNEFFTYSEPEIDGFEKAVDEFKERVPDLAIGFVDLIREAHKNNKAFQTAFKDFFEVCQTSLNPNLSQDAVDEMLVQHLLTIRLFREVFNNRDFNRRNAIAAEIEKVIDALTSKTFSRDEFLKPLDRFYRAIEDAAQNLNDFSEKQHFLNTVYERFFQGYSVEVADTHGIVYTPQPIVDFMVNSVEEVLQKEFGLHLWSEGVNILDPCTGTGNFVVNIVNKIPKQHLKRVYKEQLFANEVMLLPYYIAALNIEHAYYEQTGEYEPFEGLCFVDTLDMAEHGQADFAFMTEKNTERVEREKNTPITVIIGNPPYNVGQLNENDNNKNRKYPVIDKRIHDTYAADSTASNKNALSDAYVKFFRWGTDRLEGRDGVLCFVSNNSFVDQVAFDGMRMHLQRDFARLFHQDLHGNVRRNPRLSGTTHNVFGIQVGVGITLAVNRSGVEPHKILYHRVPEDWRRETKLDHLERTRVASGEQWRILAPDSKSNWIVPEEAERFATFIPIGTKEAKGEDGPGAACIFKAYSRGVATCRDDVVYDFNSESLVDRVERFIDAYNDEVSRWKRSREMGRVDDFVRYDKIKWSESLKRNLVSGTTVAFNENNIRQALYRPFTERFLYFDGVLNERRYQLHRIFPTVATEDENKLITTSDIGFRAPIPTALATSRIVDLHLCAAVDAHQSFPFYVYNEDGTNRRENLTDWALKTFRTQYDDTSIDKWAIFYYVYGVLHHPEYREKYGDCLKRELPRIPFAPDFRAFSKAGKELAHWHLDYEEIEPYELEFDWKEGQALDYRVEKMKVLGPDGKGARKVDSSEGYGENDRFSIVVNKALTLRGIPPKVFDYRLGNRAAIEWVVDQYQVKTDKRSGITQDPNREVDPEYIVRLIGQVTRVSLETVRIVEGLPKDFGG